MKEDAKFSECVEAAVRAVADGHVTKSSVECELIKSVDGSIEKTERILMTFSKES